MGNRDRQQRVGGGQRFLFVIGLLHGQDQTVADDWQWQTNGISDGGFASLIGGDFHKNTRWKRWAPSIGYLAASIVSK